MVQAVRYDKNDKKERNSRSFVINNVAPSNFHAPWPGFGVVEKGKVATSLMTNEREREFRQFLLQRMTEKTAGDRMRYAKQFYSLLLNGDASLLLQLQPDKRIHAMKALASLARFTGKYDIWLAIRQRYNLKWSTGNESLATFQRFFDDSRTLDSMLEWVRKAIQVLPAQIGAIIRFNTLTGLRPNEAIAAVRLISNPESFKTLYNEQGQTLEYFCFPQIYLRRTKSAYISIIEREQLSEIRVLRDKKTPSYEAIRFRMERTGVQCHLSYCRKIFGSWLRRSGIESETVDLFQGRVPRTVFVRHYFTPDNTLKSRVLEAVKNLQGRL